MTLGQIIAAVTSHYGVTVAEIKSSSREQRISKTRQFIMYLARKHTKLSLAYIGQKLGGRNHATIKYGVEAVAGLIKADPQLALDVLAFERKLGV